MKKLEEIKKHLAETAYSEEERDKIYGFIVGTFPREEFDIDFATPDNFHDFIHWFESEEKEKENPSKIKMMTMEELKNLMEEMKSSIGNVVEDAKCREYKYTGLARIALINAKSQVRYPQLVEIIDEMLNETID